MVELVPAPGSFAVTVDPVVPLVPLEGELERLWHVARIARRIALQGWRYVPSGESGIIRNRDRPHLFDELDAALAAVSFTPDRKES
jgi:hypothetical protein